MKWKNAPDFALQENTTGHGKSCVPITAYLEDPSFKRAIKGHTQKEISGWLMLFGPKGLNMKKINPTFFYLLNAHLLQF